MTEKLINWFAGRGISKETLELARVTEGMAWLPQVEKEVNCIEFNYYREGKLINTKYRDARKNFKLIAGAEKIFYNIDGLINPDYDTVVVVEGEMDALSFIEAGVLNVVSVPNGATKRGVNLDYLDDYVDYFEQKERVVLALDSDEPGQALQQEFIRRLGPEICYLADFAGCKDANDFLQTYSAAELVTVCTEAKPCPLDNVVTLSDISEELEDFVENGFKPGYQIGLEGFDDTFSTYTGQFITVTGIPSSGKSDFVDMMTVGYNKNYGWKTAYASPENKPNFIHAHKLVRKYWNGMPRKDEVGSEKWNKVTKHVDNNFYFIEMDRYDLDEVLAKGAELVKRKGIKCLVLDPFNKINMVGKSTMSITDYTMEYLARIDEFCKKYDVLVMVVAHPTKMYKDQNGKLEEPSMYSIKGGGEWYDASYHGLLVHRDYDAGTVKVKVLKVKFQNLGENGAESNYTWDSSSGNYLPLTNQPTFNEGEVPF